MSAMPHAHQMEHVLENLVATGKAVSASQELELQPQWRLVSRDGSTSSVGGPSETEKHDCPDCLAGRCGQNPQGCRCSTGGNKSAISLDRLTSIRQPDPPAIPTAATHAAMPQAKPQLFEQPAQQSPPASPLEGLPWEQVSLAQVAALPNKPVPRTSGETVDDDPPAGPSGDQPSGDGLQKVIDLWPQLPHTTRRAILALAGALNEADSA
jgi:hypothetical protein